MSRYKDYRKPRRHRDDDEPLPLADGPFTPSFFQRPSPAVAETVGAQVKWFNAGKGFGFVKLSDGREACLPLRVLETIGSRDVAAGTLLKVTLEETRKGYQVAQVLEVGELIPTASALATADEESAVRRLEASGTVKWYNSEKGFGFIAPESGGKDVFVHATELTGAGLTLLIKGQKVLFVLGQGKKGPEAQRIRLG
ncbi:cold-shock protein [Mesorhizobium sp. J8]|uniref:cold-shock protein n=1 Tax=Mesorhizobium sp. J8 TaxID=2777475 RepID=UPI0019152F76|nr:cold-shock protein [Mesorhizobium sp. J8]BCM17580.1 DNA-binding protein [Mesorhizobium sp. J8]